MARNERDFCVPVTETFRPTLRWGTDVYTSKPITGITKAAPAVVTAAGHGLPNGWPCAVVGVQGMTQINASKYPPKSSDWHYGTVLGVNTVALDDVDSSNYVAWSSGGFLVYDTPRTLADYDYELTIYAAPEMTGTPLVTLENPASITVDATLQTITPLLQTAALTWTTGYYRLDATNAAGVIIELLRGIITIE